MRITASLPPGVEALFFESAKKRRRVERKLVAGLEERGFSEIILPVLDYLDPYEQLLKSADRQELYRFVDRGGAVLALRSDFTPMLARLLAPRLPSIELPLRLFYRGDVFRYQEAGRHREFYQVGAEILDQPGDEVGRRVEEETLRSFLELLEIGERRHKLVILGVAGLLDPLLREETAGDADPGELASAVVHRDRRVARLASPALAQVIRDGMPEDFGSLGQAAAERLKALLDLCQRLAVEFPETELRIDLAEFADLSPELHHSDEMRSYYDGLIFRAFLGRAARPLGGGGRYDRLFGEGLGIPLTACGFSFKVDLLYHSRG